jgi:hypothetical protein
LGSTVILLLPKGAARWDAGFLPGAPLRMGQRIGAWTGLSGG